MFGKWLEDEPTGRYEKNDMISVKQWLAILLVTIMPVLNIVMLLGWAWNRTGEHPAFLVNFARATLIMMVILAFAIVGAIILVRLFNELTIENCLRRA